MKKFFLFFGLLFVFQTTSISLSFAQKTALDGFPPARESQAFQQFKLRPVSESSKLLYLIDRFAGTKIEIVYNGRYFGAPFAANLARWFLARNYKNQKPKEWVMRWCNTSVPAGNLIWVKLPNGKFQLAREMLLRELKELEQIVSEDESQTRSDLKVDGTPQMAAKPANVAS